MRRGNTQHGLTLIELLVTVVILSFTVALMSGAFSQIAQKVTLLIDPEKSISADFSAESPVPSGSLYSDDSKHEQKSQEEGGK